MAKLQTPRSSGRISKPRPSKRRSRAIQANKKRWAKLQCTTTTAVEPTASTSGARPCYEQIAVPSVVRLNDEQIASTSEVRPSYEQLAPTLGIRPSYELAATASEKKIGAFCNLEERETRKCSGVSDYILVHRSVWKELFDDLSCGECGMKALTFNVAQQYAYAAEFVVTCTACNNRHAHTYSSPKVEDSSLFDVNKKVVEAFLSIGKGCTAMEKFSMTLGMSDMDTRTFTKYMKELSTEGEKFQNEVLSMARKAVRKAHEEVDPSLKEEDIISIAVSFDGTWQKRGHTSNYGIGFVIDILTGLVIDYEVLSKYCQDCMSTIKSLGKDSPEFAVWFEGHAKKCLKNHGRSSNAMEMDAAVKLWKRSENECKMRYTTLLSDGDAKTFLSLQELNVYGVNIPLEKEECINHVAKRLGTGLRNAVKEWRSKGVTLGGRKQGSLTEANIGKLTNYYRAAIKNNIPNVEQMKTAVFATLYHCMSTDKAPHHNKCPGGPSSWCFFNRAIANEEPMPSHSTLKTVLRQPVVAKILPVYQRLASDQLLSRCCRGKTQNANESLHSMVWSNCPKEVFVSKKRLDLAVITAVSEFNMGCSTALDVKRKITAKTVGDVSRTIAQKRDNRRLAESRKRNNMRTQLARQKIQRIRATTESAKKKVEGPTYGAGQF